MFPLSLLRWLKFVIRTLELYGIRSEFGMLSRVCALEIGDLFLVFLRVRWHDWIPFVVCVCVCVFFFLFSSCFFHRVYDWGGVWCAEDNINFIYYLERFCNLAPIPLNQFREACYRFDVKKLSVC